jgi:putative FmdB family regulatory protein
MPTYEYECRSCGSGFEVFQSMSDAPLTVCPSCGKDVRRKIQGGTGIIFKGSGFYKNDSRKAGSASGGESSSGDSASKSDSASKAAPAAASASSSSPAPAAAVSGGPSKKDSA